MEKRLLRMAVGLCCFGAFLSAARLFAQDEEPQLAIDRCRCRTERFQKRRGNTHPGEHRRQLQASLETQTRRTVEGGRSFSEPLLAGRQINGQGFKDIVYWSSADTLYAVDSELGVDGLEEGVQIVHPNPRRDAGSPACGS